MTEQSPPPPFWSEVRREWALEWRLGLAVIFASATGTTAWTFVSSLFVEPLQQAFGWSRTEIAFAANAGFIAAFLYPVAGRWIDRWGVRYVMLPAICLTALSYVGLAAMTGSLAVYYILMVALAIFSIGVTGLVFAPPITVAFVATRGFALAITRSGVALAGFGLPPLLAFILGKYGWRGGYLTLAALMLCVSLPLAWKYIGVRRASTAPSRPKPALPPLLTLIKQRGVVSLSLAAALTYAPVIAILSQAHPMLTGKDVSPALATALLGAIGLAAFCGAMLSGALIDRIWAPIVGVVFTLCPAAGCLLLLGDPISSHAAILGFLLIGLGQGAEIDLVAFLIARYFPSSAFAGIYGLTVLTISLFTAVAAPLFARSYDSSGSYDIALIGASIAFVLAGINYLSLGRYPPRPD